MVSLLPSYWKSGLLDALRAILEPGPPEDFALKTVQEVIKPQSAAVQSGERIMEYGQSIVDGEVARGQIPRLLAVNIKGVFNTSNETKYEKEAPDGISIDFNFYKTFWSLQVVLNTFEAQPLSDEEGDANNIEDEAATFSIKYLTSSKLMGLEAPGKNDKDSPSEAMKEEIKSCEERVKKLLEMTPPKGKEFLNSIEHILERERNWVWWKRDGCPPFEKPPIEKKSVQDGVKKRRIRWRLGNKELSQLWEMGRSESGMFSYG
ncbi:nuclear matrix protein-like protein [Actinidia rufa]|uniref:Nuclear matrix protein-like protein n=1 Tax=Actinidia rufa TaxID=165716 RepID=A0A7J0F490_9ERIC|nr:nuclear matrix protein-like protein [Actinidia rufa]